MLIRTGCIATLWDQMNKNVLFQAVNLQFVSWQWTSSKGEGVIVNHHYVGLTSASPTKEARSSALPPLGSLCEGCGECEGI